MKKSKSKPPLRDPKPKRQAAKLARGFGQAAIQRSSTDEKSWCQSKDPLFKVKGIERFRRMND